MSSLANTSRPTLSGGAMRKLILSSLSSKRNMGFSAGRFINWTIAAFEGMKNMLRQFQPSTSFGHSAFSSTSCNSKAALSHKYLLERNLPWDRIAPHPDYGFCSPFRKRIEISLRVAGFSDQLSYTRLRGGILHDGLSV